jgi:hypothetical protein
MTLAPSIKWLNGTADTESLLVVDHENLSIYDVEKSVEGPSYQTVKLITSSFWSTPGTKIDHVC